MAMTRVTRYRDDDVSYAGVIGENLDVASRNPRNYADAMAGWGDAVTIDGKLFVAPGSQGRTVMVIPGSLGVGPNHEQHAETLVEAGFNVFVLDPFSGRSVSSTVANQAQYSFAASAYDVLAALRVLAEHDGVDATRIAAQGHSRGGSAGCIASSARFASAVNPDGPRLAATYAVYPWCGHQFLDPDLGGTRLRAIIGDLDEWCSLQQVQAMVGAMRAAGGDAALRLVGGAHHSFDRSEPITLLEEASVSPGAPIVYLADDGAMIDPYVGTPDPALTDRDMFVSAAAHGFGVKGARIGGIEDQAALFTEDMLAFHAHL